VGDQREETDTASNLKKFQQDTGDRWKRFTTTKNKLKKKPPSILFRMGQRLTLQHLREN